MNYFTTKHILSNLLVTRRCLKSLGCVNVSKKILAAFSELDNMYVEKAMNDWTTPTKHLQRFGDAMALLCAGNRPPDEMMTAWLDVDRDDSRLQEFACANGPVWAQGLGVIDAAMTLADQPTEGVDHEMYNVLLEEASVEELV